MMLQGEDFLFFLKGMKNESCKREREIWYGKLKNVLLKFRKLNCFFSVLVNSVLSRLFLCSELL